MKTNKQAKNACIRNEEAKKEKKLLETHFLFI